MAPMVNMRTVPAALRSATARGEHALRHSTRAIQTRGIAANAAIREPGFEIPREVPPVPVPQRKSALEKRIAAVNQAKPFSDFLTDKFNRQHDYLRISITERCNLRCLYCMPEEGIPLSPDAHMLTTPEIFYLSSLFVSQGVTKIRLTGGEPTIRRDIVPLMQQIGSLRPKGLRELALTTNGITLHRKLDAMAESGLTGVNLSLDTLDPFQFQIMTRRNGFEAVMKSINRILEMNKLGANIKLKVNCVVMRGLNEREIIPFVEMGREKEIEVRFIEYMPFGGNKWSQGKMISFQEMLDIIRAKYPDLRPVLGHKNDTSKTYEVPGFVGKVGFITSMTNDFCGSCNRLRITSDGNLKVCLHGNAEVSLRDVLRQGNNGQPIDQEAFERIKQVEMDRHEGRMSDETILGWGERERELLDVVGAAVKRKAEKHADMGDLENMTNRPMILIDRSRRTASSCDRHGCVQHSLATPQLRSSAFLGAHKSPVSPYSFLSAALAPSMLSARSYHSASVLESENEEISATEHQKSSAIWQQEPHSTEERESSSTEQPEALPVEEQKPISTMKEKPEQKYIKNPTPMQYDQILLKDVSEHGLRRSVLPKSYEQIRQKYNMTGSMYDTYWRFAAGGQLTGRAKTLKSATNARHELGRLKAEMLGKREDSTLIGEDTIPSHKSLMAEAKELAKKMRATENQQVNREFHYLVDDFENQMGLEVHPQNLQGLQALEQVSEPRARLTKRQKWRENKKIAAQDAERNMTLEQIAQRRDEKMRARAATKKIRQFTRLNKLERRSLELQEEAEDLRTREAEMKTRRLEMLRRGEELARRQKERSTDLGDVLDVATERITAEWGPFVAAERRPRPLSFRAPLPNQERTPSDDLRLPIPPSGEIYIDPDLTITFYADTATLKKQIVQMQNRLKVSYPRIDTLPYDVSKSDNHNSLQTWLKILAGRWQKRHEKAGDVPADDAEVSAILDQMVRDHDLSNHSADRMAKKWKKIMRKREAGGEDKEQKPADVSMDEGLDWDEFSAGGMGFLKGDDGDAVDGELSQDAWRGAEKLMSSGEHDAEKPRSRKDQLHADLGGLKALLASWQPRKHIPSRSAATPTPSTISTVDAHKSAPPSTNTRTVTWAPGSKIPIITTSTRRSYSTSSRPPLDPVLTPKPSQSTTTPSLPHLTPTGSAHMVSVTSKPSTTRTAIAVGTVYFSNPTPISLIKSNALKKGDVLSVSRIAGIMAAKKCPDLVPLCHPIALESVGVELRVVSPRSSYDDTTSKPDNEQSKEDEGKGSGNRKTDDMSHGSIAIQATVSCTGPTGVEMEALTAVMGAALSVVDMCKAVDRGQRVGEVRVVSKEGGRRGPFREEGWREMGE